MSNESQVVDLRDEAGRQMMREEEGLLCVLLFLLFLVISKLKRL